MLASEGACWGVGFEDEGCSPALLRAPVERVEDISQDVEFSDHRNWKQTRRLDREVERQEVMSSNYDKKILDEAVARGRSGISSCT